MSFTAHGSYKIEINNNVIMVDAHGPYNEELLTAYNLDINKNIEKVRENYKFWGQIVYLNDSALLSLEAEKKLEIESQWLHLNMGFTHCAFILVNMEASELVKKQYKRLLSVSGIKTKFCQTLSEAKEWLKQSVKI